jgi:hypothetical protein
MMRAAQLSELERAMIFTYVKYSRCYTCRDAVPSCRGWPIQIGCDIKTTVFEAPSKIRHSALLARRS